MSSGSARLAGVAYRVALALIIVASLSLFALLLVLLIWPAQADAEGLKRGLLLAVRGFGLSGGLLWGTILIGSLVAGTVGERRRK